MPAVTMQHASDVGTGTGITLIILVWAFVDFFMGVIYGVYRLCQRT